jgi:endonuclease/exonuclease/phosphatase family metal-dependent hydrolase
MGLCMVAGSVPDELVVASYNIRTSSNWAVRDGGDGMNGRTWSARRALVAKTIKISGAAVVGTQEGLGWQLDELLASLGPSWQRVGAGRYGDGGDEDELAAILFDSEKIELVRNGDFWLSESPERSSKSWGASLPRVASWATFRLVVATSGHQREFKVLNVHFDHASEHAREQSAKLVRKRVEQGLAPSGDSSIGAGVVFVTGDFNAVKTESWFKEITGASFGEGFDSLGEKGETGDSYVWLIDAWAFATQRSCGACGQGTFHAWKGSFEPSPNWRRPFRGQEGQAVALSGERHIDAIFVTREALQLGEVHKAKVLTDDRRRSNFGGPFASDHYPVVVTYRWRTGHTPRDEGIIKLHRAQGGEL